MDSSHRLRRTNVNATARSPSRRRKTGPTCCTNSSRSLAVARPMAFAVEAAKATKIAGGGAVGGGSGGDGDGQGDGDACDSCHGGRCSSDSSGDGDGADGNGVRGDGGVGGREGFGGGVGEGTGGGSARSHSSLPQRTSSMPKRGSVDGEALSAPRFTGRLLSSTSTQSSGPPGWTMPLRATSEPLR